MKKPTSNVDYVRFYAEKLKNDNCYFEQQKMLIESQLEGSRSVFKNMFSKKEFKSGARKYLRGVGLIKELQ